MTNTLGIVYFPAAVALGALHALEPGHAKALTAAYLIGIKGTKRDSVILGLSVAATHSIVVIGISAMGLWIGNEAFTGEATTWLERGSGIIAIVIGSWMLCRRFTPRHKNHEHHHYAPEPVKVAGNSFSGMIEIVDTPLGKRMKFTTAQISLEPEFKVNIDRGSGVIERLSLVKSPENQNVFLSSTAPEEPHEFSARIFSVNSDDSVSFSMSEPDGHDHHHDHPHMDDVAHARAHSETLPEYVRNGERPSILKIVGFGAAGGMIPCPASITVMLLALSTGKAALGLFTVLGFSLGLAIALVGIGMVVVSGLSHLQNSGRFSSFSRRTPAISAGLVIVSGVAALVLAH